MPLEVERRDSLDVGLTDQRVILEDIGEILSSSARDERTIQGGGSLCYLKLVLTESETAIGVAWHHTLGQFLVTSMFDTF